MTEIYLNIFICGIIVFFQEVEKKVFHFLADMVCSALGTAFPVGTCMKHSFFDDSLDLLQRVHIHGNEKDFNALVRKVRPKLTIYAWKLARSFPLSASDFEDCLQEGLFTMWRKIRQFRYFCPLCDEKFLRIETFNEHTLSVHEIALEPVRQLKPWLDKSIKMYMKNHLRLMAYPERKPKFTEYNSYTYSDFSETMAFRGADNMLSGHLVVERLRQLTVSERNPKVKMLVIGCLDGDERQEIFDQMVLAGLAKNAKSACVCVNRLMKRREVWKEYRAVLG